MAVAGVNLSLDTSELLRLQESLGKVFTPEGLAATLGSAIEKALEPAKLRLRENTPAGPTGNLKRAVNMKVVEYPKSGVAVGLLGYNRAAVGKSTSAAGGTVQAGPDRAFHQWWLEFGTKQRVIAKLSNKPYQRKAHQRTMKSGKVASIKAHQVSGQNAYIASSYSELGQFKMMKTPRPPRGESGHRVQTDPAYPNAFFRKSKTPIVIPAMNPGGSGEPPLRKTWNEYQGKVAERLTSELRISLERALEALTYTSTGSVTGATIQAGG
jgi:hypothetical protein